MKEYIKQLPSDIRDLIHRAADVADRHTVKVYLVGGFIRDLLLGQPNYDLDIVVEGDGLAYAETLARELGGRIVTHRRFGTATVYAPGHHKLDVATARKETYPQPGHLPDVLPGLLKEDLFRRDFTINAMAVGIGRDGAGELIDFFGGKADLDAGLVRVLHQVSFLDDPTRILRAVRFEQRYGFTIEPRTLNYMKEAVKLGMHLRVEPQRMRDDLILILKEADPVKPLLRLQKLCGLAFVHPRLRVSPSAAALMRRVTRELAWFRSSYPDKRKLDAWLVYFLALLEGMDAACIRDIQKKLVLRRGEDLRINSLKKLRPAALRAVSRKAVRPSSIFTFLEPLSYEVILLLRAKYRNAFFRRNVADFFEIYHGMRLSSSGHDVSRIGLPPGPAYRRIFTTVLHAKINGTIKTRDEELALIAKLVARVKAQKGKHDSAKAG